MILKTRLFGKIKILKKEIINFTAPILGFDDCRQYVLLERETSFPTFWLQSIDNLSLAFPVVTPFSVDENYSIKLSSEDYEDIQVKRADEALVLTLLVVPHDILSIRTNLRAPIVYNPQKKHAKQIILREEKYSIHYYIMNNRN